MKSVTLYAIFYASKREAVTLDASSLEAPLKASVMIQNIPNITIAQGASKAQSAVKLGSLLVALSLSLCLSATPNQALAAPAAVRVAQSDITFNETNGVLSFTIKGVQTSMVSAAIYDSMRALVKITIKPAKLSREFYWIRKFHENKRDKEIKGILVRQSKSSPDVIEIRLRYRTSISASAQDQIGFKEDATGVVVEVPRHFAKSATNDIVQASSAQIDAAKSGQVTNTTSNSQGKPTPKLNSTQRTSQPLNDDQTYTGRPSVFERGTPQGPVPQIEGIRAGASGVARSASPKPMSAQPTVLTSSTSAQSTSANPSAEATQPKGQGSDTSAERSASVNSAQSNGVGTSVAERDSQLVGMADSAMPEPALQPRVKLETSERSISSQIPSLSLDEMTQVVAYLLVFVLLLLSARFFLKRGKQAQNPELAHNHITVLSQQVVNLSPKQRILLVEVRGHTIVVGACDRGGLSPLAHLETPEGSVGAASVASNLGSGSSVDGMDALNRLSRESYPISEAYYNDDHYAHDVRYTSTGAPGVIAAESSSIHFEENTFINDHDGDSFTAESPLATPAPTGSTATGSRVVVDPMSTLDSYADSNLNPSVSNDAPDAQGEQAEEDVQPEHLLKLIQNLNNANS